MTQPDHRFDNPPIEVLSLSPRREMLQMRLRQVEMRPIRAIAPLDPTRNEPLLLDMVADISQDQISQFATDWSAQTTPRLLIVLGDVPDALRGLPVLHLRNADQLPTLPARIAIRQRELRRQRESDLRTETASLMGLELSQPLNTQTPRILYLGDSSPRFIALKAALKQDAIDTVAALSRVTAQDYLASGHFDAIILHPQTSEDEASQFLSRFTTSAQPSAPKLMLIVEPEFSQTLPVQQAEKASALLTVTDTPEDLAACIATHLNTPDRALAPPARRSTHSHDAISSLFSRAFLEAHLKTQFTEADNTTAPLCVIAMAIDPNVGKSERVVKIIIDHMRDTDMAARLDAQHICITLPATPYRGAVTLARRIEAAIGTDTEWRAIERRQFHSVKTLLSALVAKPGLRALKRA